jgi:hypothetical protein
MALSQYTLSNLINSWSEPLSSALLTAGYLLYWLPTDSLQTPDGVYPGFYGNQAAILADQAVAARLAAARGILTIRDDDFSFPQAPVRPNTDGSVAAPEDVPVPTMALAVAHGLNGQLLGLGSRERARYAEVLLLGLARDRGEQRFLVDLLRVVFDETQFMPVRDHDAGTRALIGHAEVMRTEVASEQYPKQADSMVFEFTLSARLRYEA